METSGRCCLPAAARSPWQGAVVILLLEWPDRLTRQKPNRMTGAAIIAGLSNQPLDPDLANAPQ